MHCPPAVTIDTPTSTPGLFMTRRNSPDGYGYSWGRSLGAISYMDTMEIAAFLGKHPEFRPAPLPQLASAYFAAWSWLRRDFNDETHLLSIFAFGRGDYGYITKEREWQQT